MALSTRNSLLDAIRILVAQGKVTAALKKMQDHFLEARDTENLKNLAVLQAEWLEIERRAYLGENVQVQKNTFIERLLTLAEIFGTGGIPAPAPKTVRGVMMHNIPKKIQKNEKHFCRVQIAPSEKLLSRDLRNDEDASAGQQVAVLGKKMSLEIKSSTKGAFLIESITDKTKTIRLDDNVEWDFFITPLLPGKNTLLLIVKVKEEFDGEVVNRDRAFTWSMDIESEPVKTEVIWNQVAYIDVPESSKSYSGFGAFVMGSALATKLMGVALIACAGITLAKSINNVRVIPDSVADAGKEVPCLLADATIDIKRGLVLRDRTNADESRDIWYLDYPFYDRPNQVVIQTKGCGNILSRPFTHQSNEIVYDCNSFPQPHFRFPTTVAQPSFRARLPDGAPLSFYKLNTRDSTYLLEDMAPLQTYCEGHPCETLVFSVDSVFYKMNALDCSCKVIPVTSDSTNNRIPEMYVNEEVRLTFSFEKYINNLKVSIDGKPKSRTWNKNQLIVPLSVSYKITDKMDTSLHIVRFISSDEKFIFDTIHVRNLNGKSNFHRTVGMKREVSPKPPTTSIVEATLWEPIPVNFVQWNGKKIKTTPAYGLTPILRFSPSNPQKEGTLKIFAKDGCECEPVTFIPQKIHKQVPVKCWKMATVKVSYCEHLQKYLKLENNVRITLDDQSTLLDLYGEGTASMYFQCRKEDVNHDAYARFVTKGANGVRPLAISKATFNTKKGNASITFYCAEHKAVTK